MPVARPGRGCVTDGWRSSLLPTGSKHRAGGVHSAIEDAAVRLDRLAKQVAEAMASWSMGPVVEAYQATRAVALITTVTFVVERQFAAITTRKRTDRFPPISHTIVHIMGQRDRIGKLFIPTARGFRPKMTLPRFAVPGWLEEEAHGSRSDAIEPDRVRASKT